MNAALNCSNFGLVVSCTFLDWNVSSHRMDFRNTKSCKSRFKSVYWTCAVSWTLSRSVPRLEWTYNAVNIFYNYYLSY